MEPVTLTIIGVAAAIITWLGREFGKDIAIFLVSNLQEYWRKRFSGRNILVLGPKGAGKTSLILLMSEGRPFLVKDGHIQPPEPTAPLGVLVDVDVSVDKEAWLQIKKDVSGEEKTRSLVWKQAIHDFKPHGIIYMIDGRKDDAIIKKEVGDIFSDIFAYYSSELGCLIAVHIFVSFSDIWGKPDRKAIKKKLRMIEDHYDSILDSTDENKRFQPIRTDVHAIHLSPNATQWNEAEEALAAFSADLIVTNQSANS